MFFSSLQSKEEYDQKFYYSTNILKKETGVHKVSYWRIFIPIKTHQILEEENPLSLLKKKLPLPAYLREGSRYQMGWIFGKIPNSLWPPPPHFWKIILPIFVMDMVAFMQGGIENKKHTLNPEITLLFINFMLKKPCLKFPKSAT